MKYIFTKHAIEKFIVLRGLGWIVKKDKIRRTIRNPRCKEGNI